MGSEMCIRDRLVGLAIVQSQAHEQDWGFEMRSRPGRGTSAYVTVAGIADE